MSCDMPDRGGNSEGWRFRSWWVRKLKGLGVIAHGVAAGALGFVVGYLTGAANPESGTIAAVLPGVLTLVGGVVGFLVARQPPDKLLARSVSLLIIAFSLALLIGTSVGAWVRLDADARAGSAAALAAGKLEKVALDQHIERLKECSVLQYKLNSGRKELDLPEFTVWDICPFLDEPRDINFLSQVRVSGDTEK